MRKSGWFKLPLNKEYCLRAFSFLPMGYSSTVQIVAEQILGSVMQGQELKGETFWELTETKQMMISG